MKIRDRIKEFRRVKASELVRNPRNCRRHTEAQRNALRGLLAEIGFAGAVLARELDDGRLELIDGELRADEMGRSRIPVLVLDVDRNEAATLLAALDPIGDMAEIGAEELKSLLAETEVKDAVLRQFLDDLAHSFDIQLPEDRAGEIQKRQQTMPDEPIDFASSAKHSFTVTCLLRDKDLVKERLAALTQEIPGCGIF